MSEITEKEAQCFLQSLKCFDNVALYRLRTHFQSYVNAATALEDEYEGVLKPIEISKLVSFREQKGIQTALADLIKRKISYFTPDDAEYPANLRLIPDAPPAIYVLGKLPDPNIPAVAIIGARNCSSYGRDMACQYATELAKNGIQIISGMARGIDGIAENSALQVGGYSCGVLGCGVDVCYPPDNRTLYDRSIEEGGIISEYAPGTRPLAYRFPARNRIISGLADALLVIEAREKSGTLITVSMALEQGRDIYALPGRVSDSLSYGCNLLIRDGAMPLLRPEDFVKEFMETHHFAPLECSDTSVSGAVATISPHIRARLTRDEQLILDALDYNPKTISEIFASIATRSNMTIPVLMQNLTGLTIKGVCQMVDGGNYSL